MMKKQSVCALAIVMIGSMFSFAIAFAHGEETAGEMTQMQEMALADALYTKVQSGERTCASLSDADFELLGEHFMQAILGDMHESTNAKFAEVLSHEGEEELHMLIARRGAHCESSTTGTPSIVSPESGGIATGTPALVGKTLLWIFALYGVFGLVKQLLAKKDAQSLPNP